MRPQRSWVSSKRHFRDKGWALRVPRRLQELAVRVNRALPELTQTLGRSPDDPGARRTARGRHRRDRRRDGRGPGLLDQPSLDTPVGEEGQAPLDSLGEDDPSIALLDEWSSLAPAVAELPSRSARPLLAVLSRPDPKRDRGGRRGEPDARVTHPDADPREARRAASAWRWARRQGFRRRARCGQALRVPRLRRVDLSAPGLTRAPPRDGVLLRGRSGAPRARWGGLCAHPRTRDPTCDGCGSAPIRRGTCRPWASTPPAVGSTGTT